MSATYTEEDDAAMDAIEGTHEAHRDEPDEDCPDCQEESGLRWQQIMAPY